MRGNGLGFRDGCAVRGVVDERGQAAPVLAQTGKHFTAWLAKCGLGQFGISMRYHRGNVLRQLGVVGGELGSIRHMPQSFAIQTIQLADPV